MNGETKNCLNNVQSIAAGKSLGSGICGLRNGISFYVAQSQNVT